jgi:hypothetical protein
VFKTYTMEETMNQLKTSRSWVWWCIPVIPARQEAEAEVGGSQYETGPGQKHKILSER